MAGPKVLIHGAGAVGAFLGWRLAASGCNVTVSCRSNYDVVKRAGFLVRSHIRGDGIYRPRAIKHPSELASEAFNYIFVTTKYSAGNESVIKALSSVVGPGTTLCSAQNGVSADSSLANAFPHNPILSAVCYTSVNQSTPGVVVQEACIKSNEFGLAIHKGSKTAEASLRRLVQLDTTFTHARGGAEQARWEKMIFNASWNPACALLGLDSVNMLRHPLGLTLVKALADEAYQVALACGVMLDSDIVGNTVSWAARNSSHALIPSMLRDVRAQKPVEVEALCGALVELADRYGVRVPTVLAVERLLNARNQGLLIESARAAADPLAPVESAISGALMEMSAAVA